MFEAKIVDRNKKIASLKWMENVNKEEVVKATEELKKIHQEFGNKKFYIIIDLSDFKVFAPDTKEAIIEQQKTMVPLLYEVADVVPNFLTKKQMDETKEKASNTIAKTYPNVEEALKYLQQVSVY